MDPQDGAVFLSHPVMIVTVIGVSVNIILILVLLFGQIFYHLYGPLRRPGLPKNWARPLLISSVVFVNVLCQFLIAAQSFPHYVGNIQAFSYEETCLIFKLVLASEVARNWYLVSLSIHTLFATYKPSVLQRKAQFIAWIKICILVLIFSVCFTFPVLNGKCISKQHANSVHAATFNIDFESDTFTIFHKYAPLTYICLVTLSSLPRVIGCSNRSEDTKWIHDQRISALVFQMITTGCFIIVCLVGYPVLDIVFYWLFSLVAIFLKDIREIILTFICNTCCSLSCSMGRDDKRSTDEEMTNLKSQNCEQDMGLQGIEEKNKYSYEFKKSDDNACQIEIFEDDKDDINVDTRIEIKTKEDLEVDNREYYANEGKVLNNENSEEKQSKFTKSDDFVNEAFLSNFGNTTEKIISDGSTTDSSDGENEHADTDHENEEKVTEIAGLTSR